MSDRAPRHRKNDDDHRGQQSYRGEARRFLGTKMQAAMIRGLRKEERARAWAGVAYELYKDGEIGRATYEKVVEKVQEAADE